MIGKLVGAAVGRRLAKNQSPLVGALIGAATPWLLRRAFTPVGIAVAGAFAAKKLYDKKQERDRAKVRLDNVLQSDSLDASTAGSSTPAPSSPGPSQTRP
jgi:hypothetical protein